MRRGLVTAAAAGVAVGIVGVVGYLWARSPTAPGSSPGVEVDDEEDSEEDDGGGPTGPGGGSSSWADEYARGGAEADAHGEDDQDDEEEDQDQEGGAADERLAAEGARGLRRRAAQARAGVVVREGAPGGPTRLGFVLSDRIPNREKLQACMAEAEQAVKEARFADAEARYTTVLLQLNTAGEIDTPVCGLVHNELGFLYKFTDRLPQAVEHFNRAISSFRQLQAQDRLAVEPLAKALCELSEVQSLMTRTPRDAESSKKLLLQSAKNALDAVELLESVYSSNPSDPNQKRTLAEALKSLTQVFMFQKEWVSADATIKRTIALLEASTYRMDPILVNSRMWYSQILLGMERYEEACAVCKQLEVAHTNTLECGYFTKYYGEILLDSECYSEAEETLLRAAAMYSKSDPDGPHYWATMNDLAVTYLEQGKHDKAEPILRQMQQRMNPIPDTSTKYLRTMACSLKVITNAAPQSGQPVVAEVIDGKVKCNFIINILVRARKSKRLPTGSTLQFIFPETPEKETVVVEADTKSVTVVSPAVSVSPNINYLVRVNIHDSLGALIAHHIQFAKLSGTYTNTL
ncbi:hypothetical protein Pelo_7083 [Pelomyxa schiedti]|nr:hypothetical protein Pelo_7083 [Pelomyxa schiedti]